MSGRTLVLLRHGRTAWNSENRFQGQLDCPLDELGRQQVLDVAPELAGRQPAVVVASDLQRAADTARAVATAAGAPLRLDPRLREVYLGRWQGLTRAEAAEQFPQEMAAWQAGEDVVRGGGEVYTEVGVRAGAVVADVLAGLPDGATAVLVSHGGTLRAAIGRTLELPETTWSRLGPLGNCRWAVLSEAARGWRLTAHNVGPVTATTPAAPSPGGRAAAAVVADRAEAAPA